MNFWNTNTSSTPLTLEMVERAIERIDSDRDRHVAETRSAALHFIESTPERLRDDPLVAEITTVLLSGEPVHPNTKARFKAAYEELLELYRNGMK